MTLKTVHSLVLAFCLMLLGAVYAAPAQAAGAEGPQSTRSFIAVAPLNISILKGLRSQGMLQIEVSLEIEDDDLRDRALKIYPRLQDAYVIALRHYASNQMRLYKVPNVEQIALMLQEITDQVLRQKGSRILLSQVMLHRPY